MMLTLIIKNSIGSKVQCLFELAFAHFKIFSGKKAHGHKTFRVDVQELRACLILIPLIHIVVAVGILDCEMVQPPETALWLESQVHFEKSTTFTPSSWILAIAVFSSSKVPSRESGSCDGLPWSCPPSFQPTS